MAKKKAAKKKVAKPKAKPKEEKPAEEKIEGKEVGKVTHYFDKISVAVIELKSGLNAGDKIRIKGTTTDFEQTVDSMQVEHEKIEKAKKGQAVGMKVKDRVRLNDKVYVI